MIKHTPSFEPSGRGGRSRRRGGCLNLLKFSFALASEVPQQSCLLLITGTRVARKRMRNWASLTVESNDGRSQLRTGRLGLIVDYKLHMTTVSYRLVLEVSCKQQVFIENVFLLTKVDKLQKLCFYFFEKQNYNFSIIETSGWPFSLPTGLRA